MQRFTLGFLVLAATTGTASADLRSFTRTYEYASMPEGKTAVELYHTQGRVTWDKSSPQFFEQQLELEHGITDHFDIGFYTVFAQVAGDAMTSEAFHMEEVKLRGRYRFADRGEWPVDTVAYFEGVKVFGESIYELEAKAIVARDFDKVTVAANAIVEMMLGRDAEETEPELGWAVGATYQAHPKVRVGAETWGMLEGGTQVAAGPAISLAPSSNFWVAMTAGFGLHNTDKFALRAIIGIEL